MCLALWLALWAASADPVPVLAREGFRIIDLGPALVAVVPSDDAHAHAERVLARYRRAVQEVTIRLGLPGPTRPCIVECPTLRRMRRVTEGLAGTPAPDYAEAVAIPAMDVMLIVHVIEPFADRALFHETAHLVLHARFARIPRWLDEGLAQWAAGQVPDETEMRTLRYWAYRGGVIPFASLADELPSRHDLASFAYVQSFSVVDYLVMRRGGIEKVLELLARAQVEPLQAAWEKTYGEAPDATWERWRRLEAGQFSLTGFLLYDIPIFTYLALLLLIAYVRYLVVRRRYFRADAARSGFPEEEQEDEEEDRGDTEESEGPDEPLPPGRA